MKQNRMRARKGESFEHVCKRAQEEFGSEGGIIFIPAGERDFFEKGPRDWSPRDKSKRRRGVD